MSDLAHLTLPTWVGGSLKIRHIYLVNNTSFTLTECPDKGPVVPLYLGADLLSNTDIRIENHPRIHAKFAKKGLATKLHFPSVFRFHGLRLPVSNNSLWFYSVQGLFRVAFELYNNRDQLSVLEHFQDVWKAHLDDAPLQMKYNLSEQQDFTQTKEPQTDVSKSLQELQTSEDPKNKSEDSKNTSEDHDYCSVKESSSDHLLTFYQQIKKFRDKLPEIQPEQLRTIQKTFDFLDDFTEGNLTEETVAEAVMVLLQAGQRDTVYSSSLLRAVGRWLGQQFHNANGTISQKVEGFKLQHIERISDLPPAEELSRELFPEAMLDLLLHWMGLSEDSSLDKRHSEFPILLLILEFANHNLITGVAHVLYSSLICK